MNALSKVGCLALAALLTGTVGASAQNAWVKHSGNPVMSGGGDGAWDKHVFYANVLFNADSNRYEMWYPGSAGPTGVGQNWNPYRVGFAWSQDALHWTRYAGNPVMSPTAGTWDSTSVEPGTVLRENGEYRMWYGGTGGSALQIGYATSPDGIHWTKRPEPVLSAYGTGWEGGGVRWPAVIRRGEGYDMYYTGTNASQNRHRIGRAQSPDGIVWTRDTLNNPVLSLGVAGAWDDVGVATGSVVSRNDSLWTWYTGWAANYSGTQTGEALSTDGGATWVKAQDNPVLRKGASGDWDEDHVEAGGALVIRDTLYLYYGGSRDNTVVNLWRLGVATADWTVPVVESEHLPSQFTLAQNYPNPFNPTTTIRYTLPEKSRVSLTVFNMLGQCIATLVEGEVEPGSHEVVFDASRLSSGVYLYRLRAGDYIQTRRLVVVR